MGSEEGRCYASSSFTRSVGAPVGQVRGVAPVVVAGADPRWYKGGSSSP